MIVIIEPRVIRELRKNIRYNASKMCFIRIKICLFCFNNFIVKLTVSIFIQNVYYLIQTMIRYDKV